MSEAVVTEQIGHVRHLRLNRPDKLNAIDHEVLDSLEALADEAASDEAIRAVVLSGEGRFFCAGADLDFVGARMGDPVAFGGFLRRWHEVFDKVERMPVPSFAAVHGLALAGGLELASVCDFVALARTAKVGDQHASLGLFPGGGATQRLPRQIGWRRASWLTMSGQWVEAEQALDWGLANWIFDDELLLGATLDLAAEQARRSRAASAAIKGALHEGRELPLDEALALERRIAVEHMQGADAQRGVRAMKAGRRPDFSMPEEDL